LPAFKDWREELQQLTVTAEDGQTKYYVVREVLGRARSPEPESGDWQATPVMLEIIQAQAERALEKLHDKRLALADKLSSQGGINAFSANADAHKRTQGCHGDNNMVENKFAIADRYMRTYRNIGVINVSGIVQQRTAHDFDRPLCIVSDRRKRKASAEAQIEAETQQAGFFWAVLTPELREALVEWARHEVSAARSKAREEKRSHDEEKLARREESLQRQLNTAVDKYAAALELYDQWVSQGVRDKGQLSKALKACKSLTEKLAELRRQIEMRTVGCGWTQFKVRWSYDSDQAEATVVAWTRLLLDEILPHEMSLRRNKKLPAAAAPPQVAPRLEKTLGTADADALRIEAAAMFSVDRLLERALAERARREAAGISDSVEAKQPKQAPAFDTDLVGKQLEVCWPYKDKEGKTIKIWASGKVKRIADGLTDKRSQRAKKILPAGALLWAWEADRDYNEGAGEQWLVLLPEKWNRHVQYAWRFDPCELAVQGSAVPPSAPRVDSEPEEEEFLDWEPHVESHECDESWIRRI
jgi:hypothetical protein